MSWHAFEIVGAADPVNHVWQPTQRELTRIFGDRWSAQIQHSGSCSREPCVGMPCSPVLARGERDYRVVVVVPIRVEGYGDVSIKAFDNLLRALA